VARPQPERKIRARIARSVDAETPSRGERFLGELEKSRKKNTKKKLAQPEKSPMFFCALLCVFLRLFSVLVLNRVPA
jgi:hypothetical protein